MGWWIELGHGEFKNEPLGCAQADRRRGPEGGRREAWGILITRDPAFEPQPSGVDAGAMLE